MSRFHKDHTLQRAITGLKLFPCIIFRTFGHAYDLQNIQVFELYRSDVINTWIVKDVLFCRNLSVYGSRMVLLGKLCVSRFS